MDVLQIQNSLSGIEDLLIDAEAPLTVQQLRAGHNVTVTKINWETIPVAGKYPNLGFKSLKTHLEELKALQEKFAIGNDTGGLGIVIGEAGLTWDGGTPATNEIMLAQILPNGKWRWLLKTTVGSDNVQFRGRVAGEPGTGANDYTTKAQLDTVSARAVQADWNEGTSNAPAFIKNKPTIPTALSYCTTSADGKVRAGTTAELTGGTDTQPQAWSAKQLKDFSAANSSSIGNCWLKAVSTLGTPPVSPSSSYIQGGMTTLPIHIKTTSGCDAGDELIYMVGAVDASELKLTYAPTGSSAGNDGYAGVQYDVKVYKFDGGDISGSGWDLLHEVVIAGNDKVKTFSFTPGNWVWVSIRHNVCGTCTTVFGGDNYFKLEKA